MSPRLENVTTALLLLCALAVTGMAAQRQLKAPPEEEPRTVTGWEAYARDGHVQGPANAPVQIVEFADFQCQACERMRYPLDTIRARYPNDVAVTYRHYPLRLTHPHAVAAANAAECAGDESRFFQMHHVLFADQWRIGKRSWTSFAVQAGVRDTVAFSDCTKSMRYAERIERDAAMADSMGIAGTPTLIINGRVFIGAIRTGQLEREVKRARKEASAR